MGVLFEIICIVVGAILLVMGLDQHSVAMVIGGIILLAIGGVTIWIIHFGDSSGGGGSSGGDWDFF